MTGFYARWAIVGSIACLLAMLTFQDYQTRLSTIPLSTVVEGGASKKEFVRIQGLVKSGTLTGQVEQGHATFELTDGTLSIPVAYQGPPPDNLRELKVLVLKGHWDPQAKVFRAQDTALIPNYGYVVSAYVVSFLVLSWVLFAMSRKVMVLFKEIKDSKLYEPEADSLAEK